MVWMLLEYNADVNSKDIVYIYVNLLRLAGFHCSLQYVLEIVRWLHCCCTLRHCHGVIHIIHMMPIYISWQINVEISLGKPEMYSSTYTI